MQTYTKIILALGILLSILVFNTVQVNQERLWKEAFFNQVQKDMIFLRGKIEVNEQVLMGVSSLFYSSTHVDRREFEVFVNPIIKNNPFIKALEWVPRVPDSYRSTFEENAQTGGYSNFMFKELNKKGIFIRALSRPEYFPVYYVEPFEGNESALGFDLASNSVRKKSLLLSRDRGDLFATQKINLVQKKNSEDEIGVLIFVPIFKGTKIPEDLVERQELLKGFVMGVYQIGEMLENILLPHLEPGLNLAVYQGNQINEKNRIFGNLLPNSPLEIEKALNFSGQKWRFLWQGSDEFSSQTKDLDPFVIGGAILILTFIISGIYEVNYSRTRFQTILENTIDGIITMDTSSKILSFNPAAERLFGYTAQEVLGKKVTLLMPEPYHSEHDTYIKNYLDTGEKKVIGSSREVIGLRKDGTTFPIELGVAEINTLGHHLFAGIIRDISGQKLIEEKLKGLSQTDDLTGLINRRHFDENMSNEWSRAKRADEPLSMFFMDLDRFKQFNDIYGHLKGDDCLKKVSAALKEALIRPGDIVARYGGEEFVALLIGTDLKGACHVAEKIRKQIEDLGIKHEGNPEKFIVTISLGINTIANYKNISKEDFIDRADQALYKAKERGRNRWVSFPD
jgi:diguanylate cyclase (GGDEF)-like protein/PAS domain S-box-containing protein